MTKTKIIVCEGDTDRLILSRLAARFFAETGIQKEIEVLPAYGRGVIPRMMKALEARYGARRILAVVDSDGNPAKVRAEFRTKADWRKHKLIVADPGVTSWIRAGKLSGVENDIALLIQRTNLEKLEATRSDFAEFLAELRS